MATARQMQLERAKQKLMLRARIENQKTKVESERRKLQQLRLDLKNFK